MDALLRKPLLVVTGKGGVGKSTVAAAVGLAAARRGLQSIVVEVAARDDVFRTLDGTPGPAYRERAVAERLHHISVDPEHAVREYLREHLPLHLLADALARSRFFTVLTAATPGLAELVMIGKVWQLAASRRYDLVVLDAPATGHALAMLGAPRSFAAATAVGPIAAQSAAIDRFLRSDRTGVVAVSTAEEMPVNETLQLRCSLTRELGLDLDLVVVNALFPRRFSRADEDVLRGAPASPARHAALFAAARARLQRAQLDRLRRAVRGVPVDTLPYLFDAQVAAAGLDRLSRELER